MLTHQQQALEQIKRDILSLDPSNRGRLLGMFFDAERRLKSLDANFDRSKIELAGLRTGAVWPPRR